MVDKSTPVLVVSDDMRLQQDIRGVLNMLAVASFDTVHDATAALTLLREKSYGEKSYGLVIADKAMEGIGDFARPKREDIDLARIPFVLVIRGGRDLLTAKLLGADYYITKPINFLKARAAIESALGGA